MDFLKDLANLKFQFDMKKYVQGYIQSASLAGAYSGYNPIVMNYAGVMGGINSCWEEKK